jgi:hypothetical protein
MAYPPKADSKQILDLSFPSTPVPSMSLSALLNPAQSRLPSLNTLGFRGYILDLPADPANPQQNDLVAMYRAVLSTLRGPERKKWVNVVLGSR